MKGLETGEFQTGYSQLCIGQSLELIVNPKIVTWPTIAPVPVAQTANSARPLFCGLDAKRAVGNWE